MGESISEFMDRRRREIAQFGRDAEAAAHEVYGKAIRAGFDLKLSSPGAVMRQGAKFLQEKADRVTTAVASGAEQTKRHAEKALRRAGQDPVFRSAAVAAARDVGRAAGVVKGGVHAVEGLVDEANFISRLTDPLDAVRSPPGQSATAQLGRGVVNSGRRAVNYIQKGVADPSSVVRDIREKGQEWRRDLDPSATPVAPRLGAELRRNFDIGQNQGELGFNVGSLVLGGPAAKAVKGIAEVSNIGNVERYVAQGFGPKAAARLAEPYPAKGMGSHFIPRDTKLPRFLGGGPLPQSYMDGPFNKLVPPGSSIGDMYERHFAVDPRFYGTKAGGERWSGRDLGLQRYGPLRQLWYGSPAPLKARVGGLGAAAGSELYNSEDGESGW
jgi:hypothetical protein